MANCDGGLTCGEQCVEHDEWCWVGGAVSCGSQNFTTNNEQLCSNATFWEGKTCNVNNPNGIKLALGKRCTGATQHCIYPWYTSTIYYYINKVKLQYKGLNLLFVLICVSEDKKLNSYKL